MGKLTATLCMTLAVLLVVTGCKTMTSGTTETKVISSDANHIKFRVYEPFNGPTQLDIGGVPLNILAQIHCKNFGRHTSWGKLDNSVFKIITHKCLTSQQAKFSEGWFHKDDPCKTDKDCWENPMRWIKNNPNYTNKVNNLVKQLRSEPVSPSLEKGKGEIIRLKKTCEKFGFKDGSKEMSTCMFDLYKLEKSKSQPPTVIQNNSGDSSAVRALLEEQKKQRQLEGALELMKRGSEMLNPPKPRITCEYNAFTKTTVCN